MSGKNNRLKFKQKIMIKKQIYALIIFLIN